MFLSIITLFSLIIIFTFVMLFFFEPSLPYTIDTTPISVEQPKFIEILAGLTGSQVAPFTTAEILTAKDNFYDAQLEVISNATQSIHFEAFIFHRGKVAERFLDALIAKALDGINVRLVIDAVGSFFTPDTYFDPLRNAGGKIYWYQPIQWLNLKRLNNRTHRNILVVDGEIGFIGGAGVGDRWLQQNSNGKQWQDLVCRISGPIVRGLETTFAQNWLESSGIILTDMVVAGKKFNPSPRSGFIVESSPTAARSTHSRLLFQMMIAAAQRHIHINSPYFLPDQSVRSEFIKAHKERRVSIKIVTAGPYHNHPIAQRLSRSRYGELIEAGVEIYEYAPSMIHTKSMIVDDTWCVVGSTNFDSRSFGLNDEVNFVANDEELASKLETEFQRSLQQSTHITFEMWRQRGIIERVLAYFDHFLERQA